jgi:hypothetical protein
MNRISSLIIAFSALYFAPLHSVARELPVQQCPSTLTVKKEITSSVNGKWKVVNRATPLPLQYIGIAAGEYPHEQTGPDVPSAQKTLPNGDVILYYDNPNWVVCNYYRSDIALIQQVPKAAVQCEMRYTNGSTKERVSYKCFDTPMEPK